MHAPARQMALISAAFQFQWVREKNVDSPCGLHAKAIKPHREEETVNMWLPSAQILPIGHRQVNRPPLEHFGPAAFALQSGGVIFSRGQSRSDRNIVFIVVWRASMISLHDGQCGLCSHFGESHPDQKLIQIRSSKSAPEDFVDDCGHPRHATLHLKVTSISGCDGFAPAMAA
jgi:hypothetical protein